MTKPQLSEVLEIINRAAAPYRPKRFVVIEHNKDVDFVADLTFPCNLATVQGGTHVIEETLRQAVHINFGGCATVDVIDRAHRQLHEGPESTIFIRARVHDSPYAEYLDAFIPSSRR